MKCHDTVERLPEYAAGRLRPIELTELEGHLRSCTICREEAASMRSLLVLLDPEIPSARLRENFEVWMGQQKRERSSRSVRKWMAIAAAAAMLVVLILLVPMLRQQTPEPMTVVPLPRAALARPDRIRQFERMDDTPVGSAAERLLVTLEADPNPALRITAVDALMRSRAADQLGPHLQRALRREESPLVRAALAAAMEEVNR